MNTENVDTLDIVAAKEAVLDIIKEGIRISKDSEEKNREQISNLERLADEADANRFVTQESKNKITNLRNKIDKTIRKEKVVQQSLQELFNHVEMLDENIEDEDAKRDAFVTVTITVTTIIILSI